MKLKYFIANKLQNLRIIALDKPLVTGDNTPITTVADNTTKTLNSLKVDEKNEEDGVYSWRQNKNKIYFLTVISDKYSLYEIQDVKAEQIFIQQDDESKISYKLDNRETFETPGKGIYFPDFIEEIKEDTQTITNGKEEKGSITWNFNTEEKYYDLTIDRLYFPNIWVTSTGGEVVYNVLTNAEYYQTNIQNCYFDNTKDVANPYSSPGKYRNINVRYQNSVTCATFQFYSYEPGVFSNGVVSHGTLTILVDDSNDPDPFTFDTFVLYETDKYKFKTLQIEVQALQGETPPKDFSFTISKPQGENSQTFTGGSTSYTYSL
jgi:hypothetical protein